MDTAGWIIVGLVGIIVALVGGIIWWFWQLAKGWSRLF
jgi:hypothetical protein